MLKFTSPLIRILALTAVVGSFAVAAPALAQDDTTTTDTPAASSTMTPDSGAMKPMSKMDANVEQRIKTLHSKLKITPDQEKDWNTVAQTMRDNEAALKPLIMARHENADSKTAIDDLQSYQQITQAHADGLAKLTSAFSTLYNEMSDDQKKNADEVFGKFEGHRGGKPMKHHKS